MARDGVRVPPGVMPTPGPTVNGVLTRKHHRKSADWTDPGRGTCLQRYRPEYWH